MNATHHAAWLGMVFVAACSNAPERPPAPLPTPAPAVPPSPPPVDPVTSPTTPAPRLHVVKLDNGITAAIATASQPHTATLQFGLFAGATFVVSGASELAMQVLVNGSDPSEGRPPLSQAIARLGGTLHVEPGSLMTWIDIRVPSARWREAAIALRDALAAPTRSRNQIERVRDEFVAQRIAAIRSAPATTMAELLLLGETSSATHVLGLLDRDPSEIGLVQSRWFRPERALLAIETPEPATAVEQALGRNGALGLGGWAPPAALTGAPALNERPFEAGLYWAPGAAPTPGAPCRVAVLTALPNFLHPEPAAALLFHSCFSLEGIGGRLEKVLEEHGLGHVRWTSQIVSNGETSAIVLCTEVGQNDVPALWRSVESARTSLTDVPPSASEFALALRRVPLQLRLPALGDGERLRMAALGVVGNRDPAKIESRAAEIAGMPARGISVPATSFLSLPFAMVVIGGQVPADLPQARRFELLPPGSETTATAMTTGEAAPAAASPWLLRAIEAVGDPAAVRGLAGWRLEATIQNESSPTMTETTSWRDDGTLRRSRQLLGQKIETTLEAKNWTERLGATVRSLDAREASVLRREQQRHPLALLAAHARGTLGFRTIARRDVGDRTVAVLEAIGDRFDRLRVHVDTQSSLVRTVESWETLADGTVVHLSEAWSDYRTVRGLRVPFRRVCTQDDGQNRVETVFRTFEPELVR